MKKAFVFIFCCFWLFSCENQPADEILCTEQFVTISLKVVDEDETPVALDSIKVKWGSQDITRQQLPEDFAMAQKAGSYAIVTDRLRGFLTGVEAQVIFTGYIGEEEVINEPFLVSANQCHVIYIDTKPLTYILIR